MSGEVPDWRDLAHRTAADLEATGMRLVLGTTAERIDVEAHEVQVRDAGGARRVVPYDALVIGTGACPVRPPIEGLDRLTARDRVHVVHSMGDTFEVMNSVTAANTRRAVIIGAGYLGIEMAEALIVRGLEVTQVEQLPEVLPTVDPELGGKVAAELRAHGVDVVTDTAVRRVTRDEHADTQPLRVEGASIDGTPFRRDADIVLIFAGVRPDVALAEVCRRQARVEERSMSTGRCAPTCRTSSPPATAW